MSDDELVDPFATIQVEAQRSSGVVSLVIRTGEATFESIVPARFIGQLVDELKVAAAVALFEVEL